MSSGARCLAPEIFYRLSLCGQSGSLAEFAALPSNKFCGAAGLLIPGKSGRLDDSDFSGGDCLVDQITGGFFEFDFPHINIGFQVGLGRRQVFLLDFHDGIP